jgi:hypothetical protein
MRVSSTTSRPGAPVGDQRGPDQVEQDQTELVGRPARRCEEAVGAAVVPGLLEAGADQHAGDGVQSRLGPEPAGQPVERGEGRGGEAAMEAVQQAGDRAG